MLLVSSSNPYQSMYGSAGYADRTETTSTTQSRPASSPQTDRYSPSSDSNGRASAEVSLNSTTGVSKALSGSDSKGKGSSTGSSLNPQELAQVQKLKERDREVKAHEQAHVSAGGAYVRGGPKYTFEDGPDGKQYAIGGEVGIDVSPVSGNPKATINKMATVQAAALAPADPSAQDRSIAAEAGALAAQAYRQLAQETSGGRSNSWDGKSGATHMKGVNLDKVA